MKRISTIVIAAAVLLGLAAIPVSAAAPVFAPKSTAALAAIPAPIAPVAIPVPGLVPVGGCVFTARFPLAYDNGLAFSVSDDDAFHTPMYRAGACRSVLVQSFGVFSAPPCQWLRVKTYNEDRSVRVRGTWFRSTYVGQWLDLRRSIDPGRLFRVYAYGCEPFRGRQFPNAFQIYAW